MGGEFGYAGQPEAFAARLREVLDEAPVAGSAPATGQVQPRSSTPPGTSACGSYGVRVNRNDARSRCDTDPSPRRTTRSGSPA